MRNSRILSAGFYVPPKVVTNDDLSKLMDTSDEWIVERTGIKERHFVEDGVGASDLGVEASKKALAKARLKPEDIDLIIFATLSPDYCFPGSGMLVQHKLGCRDIAAIDVRAQCSGFIYSLSIADQFIKTGKYERVLVIGVRGAFRRASTSQPGAGTWPCFSETAPGPWCSRPAKRAGGF